MMRWIIGSSLKFRFLVVAVAAATVFLGLVQVRQLPVDVFPEFAPPRVEIQTACIGLSASEVEALVTTPLEDTLNGLPGLDALRSKSVAQLSSIQLIFERGTDLIQARQLVTERLATVTPTLPTWAAPPIMLQPLSSTSRVMKIGLASATLSTIDMSMISYWTIRARLLRVPGVANVAIWGERLDMLQVQVDPERLKRNRVSLDKVMRVTADALDAGILRFSSGAVIGTGGFVDTPNQRLAVQHVLPIITPDDLAQVPVEQRGGKPLRLGDVADVVKDHQPLIGDAVINDGPGLMLIVEKLPWGNTLDVTRGVEAAIDQMRPGLPGIEIDTSIFRPATFVETAIHNLSRALLLGSILVILILIFFLYDWRAAVISAVAIPLSLLAAGMVLYLRGATINTMILAGLVISVGVVVDDAIIDVENIVRRLRQHRMETGDRSLASTSRIVLNSSLEVRSAIVYATLIDVVAILPVFFMEGLTGAFFRPLAFSYALAVLASMLVALTVTPALSLILLHRSPLERRHSPLVRWLQRSYVAVLGRIIRSPRPALAVVGVIALLGVAVVPTLGQSLLPDFKERDFLMHWVTAPGTSHPEEVRITTEASKELRAIPGVRNFGAHIGQALLADEVVGVDFGENWISVDPKVDYDKTLAAIQEVVDGYPGLRRDVQTYLKERIREVLTGSGEAIIVRISGPDLGVLRKKAEEVRRAIAGVDGIVEDHVDLQKDIPQVDVTVDLEKAQRYGIKPGDVRRAAATLIAGEEVGDVFRDGKAYDVQVWSKPEVRRSLTDIRKLLIDTPRGGHVRLSEVAEIRLKPTPNAIEREANTRKIDVGANVRGRTLGSVVGDVEARLAQVQFPLGYSFNLIGELAERQAANQRLQRYAIVAGIGILLLLVLAFGSWRLGSMAFLALPMALVGGLLAAYAFSGGIISLGSLVGFFTVLGIVARNGIMLISHCQHLERYEGETFGSELVLRGAKERLSPILMTALATGLALVPLVVAGEIPGAEIEHPMAIVILGGLVTATLLNLFIVPTLYLRFGRKRNRPASSNAGGVPQSPVGEGG
jgi:CzcA family heavy metal efflux pump